MLDYIWIAVLIAALGVPMLDRFEKSKALRRMYYILVGPAYLYALAALVTVLKL